MTKTVKIERNENTFFIPLDEFLIAYVATDKKSFRDQFNGVCIEKDDTDLSVMGTNGQLFINVNLNDFEAAWSDVFRHIIKVDVTDKAFKQRKPSNSNINWVYGDLTTGLIQILTAITFKTDAMSRLLKIADMIKSPVKIEAYENCDTGMNVSFNKDYNNIKGVLLNAKME